MALLFNNQKSSGKRVKSVALGVCFLMMTSVAAPAQQELRAHADILNGDTPFSFPEQVVVGPDRNLYFLDRTLSSIFMLDFQTKKTKRLCGPDALRSPIDISVGTRGQLWVLGHRASKVTKLSPQCTAQAEINLPRLALQIATNSYGELLVLNGTGPSLFDLYSTDGKPLRSFGERIKYQDEVTTNELNDGHIVPDTAGGFFFSFNYPPLIRHYGRTGRLVSELKPESDIAIAPPTIAVNNSGNSVSVVSKYQILVLDIAAYDRNRLYLLMSGKNKIPALHQGTPKLTVLSKTGQTLKNITLDHSFHRLVVRNGRLYLLRNRPPLRLNEYVVF
jgi:hypothetical protein